MCALVGLEELRDKASLRKQEAELLQLFSPYDSVILLSGITDHTQAKAAEKLLADCLAIVYPHSIANRKEPEGFRYSVDCMGCVYWMPVRYTGDATVFDNVRSLIDAAPKPKKKPAYCADLGVRFDHVTPLDAVECSQEV